MENEYWTITLVIQYQGSQYLIYISTLYLLPHTFHVFNNPSNVNLTANSYVKILIYKKWRIWKD